MLVYSDQVAWEPGILPYPWTSTQRCSIGKGALNSTGAISIQPKGCEVVKCTQQMKDIMAVVFW